MLLCNNDIAVYFGKLNAVAHSHYAVEMTISLDLPLQLLIGKAAAVPFEVCMVLPNVKHKVLNHDNCEKITILVDGDSLMARALVDYFFLKEKKYFTFKDGFIRKHLAHIATARLSASPGNSDNMYGAISGMIDDLLPRDYKKNTQPLDKRIEYIAWYIQHNIQLRHFSLAELARKVELSESGFMHLFTTEIGIPLRKYVQWKRVKSAALEVQRGLSLTNAALAAGFSDLGHFSKVYKSMIGLMPSAVLKQKF